MAITFPPYRRVKSTDYGITKLQDYIQETAGNLKRAEQFFNRYAPKDPLPITVVSGATLASMADNFHIEAYRSIQNPEEWLVDLSVVLDLTYPIGGATTSVLLFPDLVQARAIYQSLAGIMVYSTPVAQTAIVHAYTTGGIGKIEIGDSGAGPGTVFGTQYFMSGTIRLLQKPSWVPAGA